MRQIATIMQILAGGCIVLCILIGCSQGTTERVEVTIHHVYDNPSKWGCVGTNIETYVQNKDGRMDPLCGNWGKPGDTLTGYWTEGHWDDGSNRFHLSP